jgi:hypothetical protein
MHHHNHRLYPFSVSCSGGILSSSASASPWRARLQLLLVCAAERAGTQSHKGLPLPTVQLGASLALGSHVLDVMGWACLALSVAACAKALHATTEALQPLEQLRSSPSQPVSAQASARAATSNQGLLQRLGLRRRAEVAAATRPEPASWAPHPAAAWQVQLLLLLLGTLACVGTLCRALAALLR